MLHTDVIYVVSHLDDDGSDYGWSPDGEGMYWRDSMAEVYHDAGFSSVKCMTFSSAREFDNHRYGHMPEDWGFMDPYDGAWVSVDDPAFDTYEF